MKKLSILLAAVILAVASLIAGCGSSSVADEFVGTWEHKTDKPIQTSYITIEKKGDKNFIVNQYVIDSKGALSKPDTRITELKDKILVTPEGRIIEINNGDLTYHYKEYLYKKIDKKVLNYDELSNKIK